MSGAAILRCRPCWPWSWGRRAAVACWAWDLVGWTRTPSTRARAPRMPRSGAARRAGRPSPRLRTRHSLPTPGRSARTTSRAATGRRRCSGRPQDCRTRGVPTAPPSCGPGESTAYCFLGRTSEGNLQSPFGAWREKVLSGPLAIEGNEPGPPAMVTGAVDPAAAAVEIETASGLLLRATTGDGRFVAWWPGADPLVAVRSLDADGNVLATVRP